MPITEDRFSPWYDPNIIIPETGLKHQWEGFDGTYYGPSYYCANCGKKNTGWNLWKEDLLPNCPGKNRREVNYAIRHCAQENTHP